GLGGSTGAGGSVATGTAGTIGNAGTIGSAGTSGTTTGGSSGTTCTSEDCGTACTIPTLPAYSAITATNAKLPDPFLMLSGTRMTSKSQWECRRAELDAEFQTYELGQKNPTPAGTVTGSMSGSTLTVSVGGKSFTVTITLPTTGTAPYPAIIALDGGSLPSSQIEGLGVAMISMSTMALGDQTAASSRGDGFFFTVNGVDNGAGSLVAWAWGASRIIDALAVTPAAKIDPTRIGVTGCSRNGKGALAMGALDERVKLTIVQEAGSGGTASWRVSDNEDGGKNIVQTLGEIVGEDDWFSSTLTQFANAHAATKLPEDHHELLGMVAPRGLFVIENTEYQWLGVNSCVTDATAAQMIFQGLGVKDNMAFEQHGHAHCAFDSAEWPDLQAYIQKFLLNQNVTASAWNVTTTQFGSMTSTLNMSMWIDWTVPTLD
ncbi:MAG TPA: dockerin-like protein, partial [Polyangia bacterium]|nr:dockerin-like protein [Polyangia bacterium]